MPSAFAHEQVIVANVDQVIIVFAAANPRPAWHLLDRYLVSAEASEIPALVCLTKMDLVRPPQAERSTAADRASDWSCSPVPSMAAPGRSESRLQGARPPWSANRGGQDVAARAAEPGLGLRVVRRNRGAGRHTTSTPEIFSLHRRSNR
jgi:ribosome biogenesis GTPase